MEIHQKIPTLNYQKLKTVVKRSIDQKLRLRNFDARHRRIGTGAVVKNRRRSSGVEGGKGVLVTRKKAVFERRSAQFPTRVMIVKNRHQKPLHPLSHLHQEAEVRREKMEPNKQTPVCEVQPTAVQKLLERYFH